MARDVRMRDDLVHSVRYILCARIFTTLYASYRRSLRIDFLESIEKKKELKKRIRSVVVLLLFLSKKIHVHRTFSIEEVNIIKSINELMMKKNAINNLVVSTL